MAGVKVTDLPSLGTAASDDIMYIVDTSTNTSKQIEVQNLVGGLPDIESGAWNPTPTNIGGTNAIFNSIRGNYSRVGTVVTCSLLIDLGMGTGETLSNFELDLPISSNFTSNKDAFGIISQTNLGDGELAAFNISANISNNKIGIEITSLTAEHGFQFLIVVLQYVIVP
jgi:hypothetical protein